MGYTEGEWKVQKAPTNHLIVVDTDIMGETDCGVIADVYSCFTGISEANAHLIAAAPDLYEALRHTEIVLENRLNDTENLTQQEELLLIEARLALAKARLNSLIIKEKNG